jgi:hypothetical protein
MRSCRGPVGCVKNFGFIQWATGSIEDLQIQEARSDFFFLEELSGCTIENRSEGIKRQLNRFSKYVEVIRFVS